MIYAKLTEELKSAPKTDNPEYTIFLRKQRRSTSFF